MCHRVKKHPWINYYIKKKKKELKKLWPGAFQDGHGWFQICGGTWKKLLHCWKKSFFQLLLKDIGHRAWSLCMGVKDKQEMDITKNDSPWTGRREKNRILSSYEGKTPKKRCWQLWPSIERLLLGRFILFFGLFFFLSGNKRQIYLFRLIALVLFEW